MAYLRRRKTGFRRRRFIRRRFGGMRRSTMKRRSYRKTYRRRRGFRRGRTMRVRKAQMPKARRMRFRYRVIDTIGGQPADKRDASTIRLNGAGDPNLSILFNGPPSGWKEFAAPYYHYIVLSAKVSYLLVPADGSSVTVPATFCVHMDPHDNASATSATVDYWTNWACMPNSKVVHLSMEVKKANKITWNYDLRKVHKFNNWRDMLRSPYAANTVSLTGGGGVPSEGDFLYATIMSGTNSPSAVLNTFTCYTTVDYEVYVFEPKTDAFVKKLGDQGYDKVADTRVTADPEELFDPPADVEEDEPLELVPATPPP